MTSSAIVAEGTILRYSDDSGSTWNAIAEVKSYNGPNAQRSEIDVSSFDSTAKEFKGGLTDYGEISFDVNYRPDDTDGQAVLLADLANADPTTYLWQIIANDASQHTAEFSGYVKSFAPTGSTDGVLTGSVTIRVTGTVTYQTGTA